MSIFFPSAGQIVGLLSVVAHFVLFAAIGGAISGRRRFAAVDIFVGWGVATGIFVLGGVFLHVPFTWIVAGLWAAILPCSWLAWRRNGEAGIDPAAIRVLWRVIILALPLLFLVSAMRASQWDEFAHWLPNAQYILRHDAFPGPGMPASTSAYPAYPYTLPLITYLASKLAGGFVENAGAIANLFLHLLLAPIYLSVFRSGRQDGENRDKRWGTAAFGILGVTVLSTVFVQKLVFTTYADSTTAVALAVIGVLAWKILEARALNTRDGEAAARKLAWQFAWVAVILINIKQPNLALLGLLLCGMLLVALRDPKLRLGGIFRLLPIMLLPALSVYIAWRYHAKVHLSDGEVIILSVNQWRLGEILNIFTNMLIVASRKGFYFSMMGALTLYALYALWRYRPGFNRLAVLSATVFVGFNLVLLVLYMIAFDSNQASIVISYWRFNTQLGLLGCIATVHGVAILLRNGERRRWGDTNPVTRLLPACAIVFVIFVPIIGVEKLRFDIRPHKDHMRMIGQELGRSLPPGTSIAILDPNGNGLAAKIVKYELTSGSGAGRGLGISFELNAFNRKSNFKDAIVRKSLRYIWVHQSLELVENALNVTLPAGASHLLKSSAGGIWTVVQSWRYEGYNDPFALPD
jgi:hypothetical protein